MALLKSESADCIEPLSERRPADRHPAHTYLGRLSAGSRPAQQDALDRMARELTGGMCDMETMPWERLRWQHTNALRSWLIETYAPATASRYLSALRGVLRDCWRLELLDAESYQRAVDLEPVRGSREPRGRALAGGEIRALFEACAAERTVAAATRNAALLAVAYGAGLRRAELVGLDVADYEPGTGAIHVRRGKGNRERTAYATNGAAEAIGDWLGVRGDDAGPLFLPVLKSGKIELRRMTGQAVLYLLRSVAKRAAVSRFSPHDMRRTFISDLWDAGVDGSSIQRLAGHANQSTTVGYDRRGERAKRRAAETLHVPYVRRADLLAEAG
jgi:integrase